MINNNNEQIQDLIDCFPERIYFGRKEINVDYVYIKKYEIVNNTGFIIDFTSMNEDHKKMDFSFSVEPDRCVMSNGESIILKVKFYPLDDKKYQGKI